MLGLALVVLFPELLSVEGLDSNDTIPFGFVECFVCEESQRSMVNHQQVGFDFVVDGKGGSSNIVVLQAIDFGRRSHRCQLFYLRCIMLLVGV